jgi:O-antigen ligase
LISVIPVSAWLRGNLNHRLKLWVLLGFLPFIVEYFHLYMAVDSAAEWGGYVKGVEISGLDLLALCLYLSSPRSRHRLAFRYSMLPYFLTVVFSASQALAPMMSLFYPWQLARMFLVYATVSKGCSDSRVTWALLKGMAAAVMIEAALVLYQRFGLGLIQTDGTVGHQNMLGLMLHLVILPFFALLLAGRRGALPVAVVLTGAVIDVSTASRGTITFSALGFAATFVLSAIGNWTPRKARVALVTALALTVAVPAAIYSLEKRFEVSPWTDLYEGGYDERQAYKDAAAMMLSEHPLGIGANHFAVIGNVGRYYDKNAVQEYAAARAGNVHNIYYLVAAETGYAGLISLLILLGAPLIVAFRCGWHNLGNERGNLLLGLGVALSVVYFHSWLEWSLATFSAEYLLAMAMGLVAANASELGYWRAQPSRVDTTPGNKLSVFNQTSSRQEVV